MFRKKLNHLLELLILFLERQRRRVQINEEVRVDMPFHALTPVTLQKKNENQEEKAEDKTYNYYEQALKWAIQQEDCFNIALSGIYGSGKSSIINTFITRNKYASICISLATFQEGELEKEKLYSIERSIIQQILFTVDESKIPNSRFKRIKSANNQKLFGQFIKLFSMIAAIYLFFNLNILCSTPFPNLYDNYLFLIQLILGSFTIYMFWKYFKKYSSIIQNIGIEKFNLKSGEIAIKDTSKHSILNEYIDELIYFFTENTIDIVVFEDLDRFNNLSIFTNLRELNLLLNSNERIKSKGKVVFLYAVKDDLFKDTEKTERVKFFDFILPVISVINSSNSYAKLKELLGEGELKDLSDEFLQDISLYINDLRLLKNICNEYLTFKKLIKDNVEMPFDPNKLLAMAIYKNYFPKDYNELILDKGNLYYLLSKEFKQKLNESAINDINTQIDALKAKIDDFEKAIPMDLKDIQMMYLYPLIQKLKENNVKEIYINERETIHLDNIDDRDLMFIFKKPIAYPDYYGRKDEITIDYDLLLVNKKSYTERLNYETESKSKRIEDLRAEIQVHLKKKQILSNNDLCHLIDEYGKNLVFLSQKVEKQKEDTQLQETFINPIVNYLLRNGLIDENYQFYISHYIDGGLTKNDIHFLSHVNEGQALEVDFSYKLNFISEIVKRIRPSNYTHEALLNLDFINYLIDHSKEDILGKLKSPFKLNSQKSLNFFEFYIGHTKNFTYYINFLEKHDSNLVNKILKQEFSIELKTRILRVLLLSLDAPKLQSYNKNNELLSFLNTNELLVNGELFENQELLSLLGNLHLHIQNIAYLKKDEVLSNVVENKKYALNLNNISFTYKTFSFDSEEDMDKLMYSMYTELDANGTEELLEYVNDNFSFFIQEVYSKLEIQNESEECFIQMLDLIEDDANESLIGGIIISKTNTIVSKLELVSNLEFQDTLLSLNRIKPNWENVYIYLSFRNDGDPKKLEFTLELLNYISSNIEDNNLSFSKINDEIMSLDDKSIKLFKQNFLLNDKIRNDVFEKMISEDSEEFINEIPLESWGNTKLKILILNSKLQFSDVNTAFIREAHSDLFIDYCISNFSSFLDEIHDFELDNLDLEKIIMSDKLSLDDKIKFITLYNFTNHTDVNLFPNSIVEFVSRNIDSFTLLPEFHFENMIVILKKSANLNIPFREDLFIKLLKIFSHNKDIIQQIVMAFDEEKFSSLFDFHDGTTQRFELTNENRNILQTLVNIDIIGKVKESKNDFLVYKKNSTKK